MRVLLITPPMTQLNTPYPATSYLAGFLKEKGYDGEQEDFSIQLFLKLFSKSGLIQIHKQLKGKNPSVRYFQKNGEHFIGVIDPVIRFLQGKDPTLAYRVVMSGFLPVGPRMKAILEDVSQRNPFGEADLQDRAKYFSSLFVDEIAEVIREGIDSRFELSRYAEKIAASQPEFDPLLKALENSKPTIVDEYLDELTQETIRKHQPDVVCLSAPFPGNVYGAFRVARQIKRESKKIKTVLGGGYVNTELRELSDPRVFDYFDFVTLDDGERPILSLLEGDSQNYVRTFVREKSKVVFKNNPKIHDIPFKDAGTPTYRGLDLSQYVSLLEVLNPMHRLWSDGRWNKLTLAHGCYWKKCSFCDVTLDYIGRYQTAPIDITLEKIEKMIQETGQTGFHFVDEAAPPAVLRALAEKLIEKNLKISWWGNIRFEKTFTPELCELLARSGCVAVSGGLEVASDRLLKLMEKGVTFEQVTRVTHAFSQAGILVHTYLMYGFPSQTECETVDALERVRQLFEQGCIHSAYWHRFSATAHSPIGKNPMKYGIKILGQKKKIRFAKNDLNFSDPVRCNHAVLGLGLKRATYHFMQGVGFDKDVSFWFDRKVSQSKIPKDLVASLLQNF